MPGPIDLRGAVFTRLTVLPRWRYLDQNGHLHWICLCDCGEVLSVRGSNLRAGRQKSCGCLARELAVTHWGGKGIARPGGVRVMLRSAQVAP